jgi:hypothetical protein
MCDVPKYSTVVFCRESVECFPGIVSRYFFSPLVTIPVAPMITDRYDKKCHVPHSLNFYTLFFVF